MHANGFNEVLYFIPSGIIVFGKKKKKIGILSPKKNIFH